MSSIMFKTPLFRFSVPSTPPPSAKVSVFPLSLCIVVVPWPKISLSNTPDSFKLELLVIFESAPVARFSANEINSPSLITTLPCINPLLSATPPVTLRFPVILPLFCVLPLINISCEINALFIISSVPANSVVPVPSTVLLFSPALNINVPSFVILFPVVIILFAEVVNRPPLSLMVNTSCVITASFITDPSILVVPIPSILFLFVPFPWKVKTPSFVMPFFIARSEAFAIKLPVICISFCEIEMP